MSVPDEGYLRNVSCALNYISTFKLQYKSKKDRNVLSEKRAMLFDCMNIAIP